MCVQQTEKHKECLIVALSFENALTYQRETLCPQSLQKADLHTEPNKTGPNYITEVFFYARPMQNLFCDCTDCSIVWSTFLFALRCLWFYTFVTCLKIFLRIKFLPVCGVDAAGWSRSWFLLVLWGLWASPLLWTEQSKHLEVHAGQDGEDQHWDNCTLLVVSFPLGVLWPTRENFVDFHMTKVKRNAGPLAPGRG